MKNHLTKAIAIVLMSSLSGCSACNDYYRSQNLLDAKNKGEAALLESENSKKVAIETAKANFESAKLNADADIIRAKGIAEANKIIGESLENNRAYLEWLWIDNIKESSGQTFYIPTENKVPIFSINPKVTNKVEATAQETE